MTHLFVVVSWRIRLTSWFGPHRESARRSHPLSNECDIVETCCMRLSLLQMSFGRHIEHKHCCFFPGAVSTSYCTSVCEQSADETIPNTFSTACFFAYRFWTKSTMSSITCEPHRIWVVRTKSPKNSSTYRQWQWSISKIIWNRVCRKSDWSAWAALVVARAPALAPSVS